MAIRGVPVGSWIKVLTKESFADRVEVGDLGEVTRNDLDEGRTIRFRLLSGRVKGMHQVVTEPEFIEVVWLKPQDPQDPIEHEEAL